jgi:hypothetical protein
MGTPLLPPPPLLVPGAPLLPARPAGAPRASAPSSAATASDVAAGRSALNRAAGTAAPVEAARRPARSAAHALLRLRAAAAAADGSQACPSILLIQRRCAAAGLAKGRGQVLPRRWRQCFPSPGGCCGCLPPAELRAAEVAAQPQGPVATAAGPCAGLAGLAVRAPPPGQTSPRLLQGHGYGTTPSAYAIHGAHAAQSQPTRRRHSTWVGTDEDNSDVPPPTRMASQGMSQGSALGGTVG